MTLPRTGAGEWAAAQETPWETVNLVLRLLDAGAAYFLIEDRDLTAPPGSCADGACYLVHATATGTWAGKDGKLAVAIGANASNGWKYITAAIEGFELYVRDEYLKIRYNGSAWVTVSTGAVGTASALDYDTDGTLAANSDARLATQKAVKTYVDGLVAGLLDYKGTTDCSTNPNYPAASKGDVYIVSVAGKIGGASGTIVDAGDWYVAKADNAGGSEASVGSLWGHIEHNVVVSDDAYDATSWNGNLDAPTKNAVRDKIEAIIAGAGTAASTTEQLTGTDAAKLATPDSVAALWEQGSDVASAGTVSLGEGGYFNITGTTTISDIDFATDKAGRKAWVKFAGILTLTHNASTLILPGGANITTAAGDTACFVSEGSDVVRCLVYQKANGQAVSGGGGYTDENARDAIGAALNSGTGIAITVNDGADTITVSATETTNPAHSSTAFLGFNLTRREVLISKSGTGWKQARVESPFVFFDPKLGKYRMLYVGYSGTVGSEVNASHGYATSSDLINWTEYGSNPFFQKSGTSGAPDENGVSGPVVWYEDGTYYLFYIGLTATGYEQGTKSICLATSTDFATWTRHGAVITTQASTWRSNAVWHPNIVKRGATYYMFFNATNGSSKENIGYATSADLITWTVDDVNSPVLSVTASAWDANIVGDPFVWRVGETWFMSYFGYDGANAQSGIAQTSDADFPLNWAKFSGNPTLTYGASGTFDDMSAGRGSIVPTGNRLFQYYSTDDGSGNIAIAYATDDSLALPAFKGALVYKTANQTGANYSSDTAITWDSESYDTLGFHSTSSNTSRITIPAGVKMVRLTAGFCAQNVTAGAEAYFQFKKNGGNSFAGWAIAVVDTSSTQVSGMISSPPLAVVAGDYFEAVLSVPGDSSIDIMTLGSWFAIEVLG